MKTWSHVACLSIKRLAYLLLQAARTRRWKVELRGNRKPVRAKERWWLQRHSTRQRLRYQSFVDEASDSGTAWLHLPFSDLSSVFCDLHVRIFIYISLSQMKTTATAKKRKRRILNLTQAQTQACLRLYGLFQTVRLGTLRPVWPTLQTCL